ncbi:MAG: DUF1330 domain-containing protein [Alphaproteobacteria bacterium]
MAAYVIVRVTVTDGEKFKGYQALTPDAVAKNGGKFIVRGGDTITLEGEDETRRVVVIEFADMAAAQAFWNSPEYAEAKVARENAADFQAFIVDGV